MNRRDAIKLGMLSPLAAVAAAKGAAESVPESPALAMLQAAVDHDGMWRLGDTLETKGFISTLGHERLVWVSVPAPCGGTVPAWRFGERVGWAYFCEPEEKRHAYGALVLDVRDAKQAHVLGKAVAVRDIWWPMIVPIVTAGKLVGVDVTR